MNTQVELCKKMGGLRREFARYRLARLNTPHNISKTLAGLARKAFKFKTLKFQMSDKD